MVAITGAVAAAIRHALACLLDRDTTGEATDTGRPAGNGKGPFNFLMSQTDRRVFQGDDAMRPYPAIFTSSILEAAGGRATSRSCAGPYRVLCQLQGRADDDPPIPGTVLAAVEGHMDDAIAILIDLQDTCDVYEEPFDPHSVLSLTGDSSLPGLRSANRQKSAQYVVGKAVEMVSN